jgi:PAS domain S-box-containing protein
MHIIDPSVQLMLKHAIDQVQDFSIALLTIQGLFVFWNKGAAALDGYEAEEIIGKPLKILMPAAEKNEKLDEFMLNTALKEGRSKHVGRRLKKDGTIYWASVVLNSIYDENGTHLGFIRIARELRGNEIG